jgi:long-chain acyl-CoA synthetase
MAAPWGDMPEGSMQCSWGYYKDTAKTKEAIDEDGWLHTGDVGTILPENGAVKIIDRKKNIFKLQQGEYVAAEKVEAVYLKEGRLEEVFLHGESTQNFAVAVIIPAKPFIRELIGGAEDNQQARLNERPVREKILAILNDSAKKSGLMSFEQAKNIFVEVKPFALQGIVSSTMKLQRHEAKKFYKKEIDEMYREGMLGGKKE